MKKILVLLSGGAGNRYKAKVPKQYTKQASGDYYILDSVRPFLKFDISDIVVVCDLEFKDKIINIIGGLVRSKMHFCEGGKSRQLSINNAIHFIKEKIEYDENTFIFLQEAVRPFVSEKMIENLIAADTSLSNVSTAINPAVLYGKYNPDTNEVEELIDKSSIVELQIPKRYNLARYIFFMEEYKGDPTDFIDESLYFTENNVKVFCVKGEFENIKITLPSHRFIAKGISEFKKESNS